MILVLVMLGNDYVGDGVVGYVGNEYVGDGDFCGGYVVEGYVGDSGDVGNGCW